MGRDAVRMVGLKLLLLSASLAAIGAVVPAEPHSIADTAWGGMKLLHLILGTASAGASLFFRPQVNGKILGATISCGILFALAGPPFLVWGAAWWTDGKTNIPAPVENMLAIVLGVLGVYVIPALQKVGETIRANPLGFFSWFKGGGTAPPPGAASDDKGGQP